MRLAKKALADESLSSIVKLSAIRPALWVDHPERLDLARATLAPELHEAYVYSQTFGNMPMEVLMKGSDWQDEDLNLLIGAMNASASGLYQPAIQAAQQLRHPHLLSVLSSLCRETADDEKQMLLVQAMGSYMTREAGEQLVQCLGAAVDHNVRGTIQNQLVQIRSYLEEAEYWAGEEKRQATESQAILDLVAMLDDEDADIRAAAIDGLASFGAKEYLPRIIRMMKDDSNKVQRAARNAVRLLQHGVVTEDEGDSESGQ